MLTPVQRTCWDCHQTLRVIVHKQRTVLTLTGRCQLTLVVRQCENPTCPRYRRLYRPEAEGAWALPQGETGLDVIHLVGQLRYRDQRSVPQIHEALQARGVLVAPRTVLNLLYRYEELLALRLRDHERLRTLLQAQGEVILALDGLQPDVGHEVLWAIRATISGQILLAKPLLSATSADLGALLTEVKEALTVPVRAVVSDGQGSIRLAVAQVFPDIPHQICQFHYLREAAKEVYEADRHAKKELKKQLRGIREIERQVAGQDGDLAAVTHDYCLAVRGALTDDGPAPLAASGLLLEERVRAIADSLARMAAEKGG
jgi:hypothetical protein